MTSTKELSSFTLQGIVPPLLTPFTRDGELDTASLERLVQFQVDSGVHGLFIFGSTGEFPALTSSQRARYMDVVLQTVNGRVPVLAGIADTSTARSLALAKEAEAAGIDALVLTAPYYHMNSQSEIIDHFRAIRHDVDLPLVAYNIPQLVKVHLDVDTIVILAEEQTIAGLKDSGPDLYTTRQLLMSTRHLADFRVLTGLELMVDVAMMLGAHGAVPGLGNVAPREYVALYEACLAERWQATGPMQERLIRLFDICAVGGPGMSYSAAALSAFKAALCWKGILSSSHMARPMRGLSEDAHAEVRRVLEELNMLAD